MPQEHRGWWPCDAPGVDWWRNKYVEAWSLGHFANKYRHDFWVDPRSPVARSKFNRSSITGKQLHRNGVVSEGDRRRLTNGGTVLSVSASPGDIFRRPERVGCTAHSVDDAAGWIIGALDAYDIGCRLRRQCTVRESSVSEEPCLFD